MIYLLALAVWLVHMPVSAHMFCNMDASESTLQAACLAGTSYNGGTILFADDFEDGVWMDSNADTNGGVNNPANDGWRGTIFHSPYPKNATCSSAGSAGTDCTADTGFIDGDPNGVGAESSGFFGKHEFSPSLGTAVTDIYYRMYLKLSSDFEPGHHKHIFIQNDSGYQCCGLYFMFNTYELGIDVFNGNNIGWKTCNIAACVLAVNKWYYIELHVNLGTAGQANGTVELWVDDCGTNGLGCTGTPTLRAQHTGQRTRDTSDEDITLIWLESYGNPGSKGTLYYDQTVASTAFVGFADFAGGGSSTGGSMDVKNRSSDLILVRRR